MAAILIYPFYLNGIRTVYLDSYVCLYWILTEWLFLRPSRLELEVFDIYVSHLGFL